MTFSQIATALNARHVGADAEFKFVSIDTRTINPGELFVAVKGPNFDGHDFVADAAAKGAVGAVVTQVIETGLPADFPLLVVNNTTQALGELAKLRRAQVNIPVLAVTGSCGKTTTKSMMASIMSRCGAVHAGKKSFNNHYGLPLTLLGISEQHQYAVVEMGANHFHEIANLTQIARPTVAAITIAAPVHLEGFGDLDGVSRAKGEIFSGLTADGTAVINLDDGYADYWQSILLPQQKVVTFGYHPQAQVRACEVKLDQQDHPTFMLQTPAGEISVTLPLLGEHNIVNAMAAAAICYAAGASLQAIADGLENVIPVAKRMVLHKADNGIEIVDDSYNANPVGLEAALKVLAQGEGKKILVLGEMGELGKFAEEYHRQLGQTILNYGIERLYAVGQLARHTVDVFGENGFYFGDKEQLIAQLKQDINPPMRILIKGSRSTQMEQVVSALLDADNHGVNK